MFAEVDDSLGIDPADLEAQLTDRTAAIIAVHLENVACDLDAVLETAARHCVPVVEDAAQSFGATYHGRALGTFGALGAFPLQQEKNITSGEGGLVTTGDETLYLRAARFQDQGGQFVTSYASARGDELTEPFTGENLRMGELAGAVAGVQLGRLPGIPRRCAGTSSGSSTRSATSAAWLAGAGPIPTETDRRASPGSCPTRRVPSGSRPRCAPRGSPARQMYRGRPVYLNAAVLARRTASDKGGPWACAEHPTERTYDPGLCPRTEELVARSVIVPIGIGYDERACHDVASAVRKVAAAVLQ